MLETIKRFQHENQTPFCSAILLFVSCTGYYGVVRSTTDEYKNSRTIRLLLSFHTREYDSEVKNIDMTFVRVILPGGREEAGLYAQVDKSSSAFDLKEEGFIKIDGRKFPIVLQDRRENTLSKVENTTTTHSVQDTSGVSTLSVVTGSSSTNWKQAYFYCPLSTEQVEAIKNCRQLEFRYYAGPDPATISVKPSYLGKIRKWAEAK
ncbi:MAG: hypothetical protein IPJ82_01930 [Lewinellaceae bacterium]|nr:hypothetical protein [Lewinellaceae bacterium]